MNTAITVRDLSKSYGKNHALQAVSFDLQAGQWCVLLGENGAGKSTLIQLLCGLFTPDSGAVYIDGHDLTARPCAALAALGVVFQQPTLDMDQTVLENLRYHAGLHGLPASVARERIEQGLAWVGLQAQTHDRVRSLSGGNRRRVELVRSLLHRPRVLLMDEASVGLDPVSREQLLGAVAQLVREQGLCVLWTTHWAHEVAQADVLMVLQKGRLIFSDTPEQLLAQTGQSQLDKAFLAINHRA
jgi:ABC-2 type transport system ATP-binding protein